MQGWFLHVAGIDNQAGRWYAFWSGVGADLAYLAAFAAGWHHLNCHQAGCWRIARHGKAGYCRKHSKENT